MRKIFMLSMLALACFSCEDQGKGKGVDADNTGRNVRDRDAVAKTPFDQGESEADRTITQRLRQAIVADDTLSTNAKNIKIITNNGVITLRGPVNSPKEKDDIMRKVQAIAGNNRVENQIEVTRNP
ncbi:MAG: BON domain-containing protein [Parachlamydiaceae bacterium]|nr:BON domain-containing protein [Parachlamydiaceae bacterium]